MGRNENGRENDNCKSRSGGRIFVPLLTAIMILAVLLPPLSDHFLSPCNGWSNGGYSKSASAPYGGTHDWIVHHAIQWLPSHEKIYIEHNIDAFFYGTELPDNSGPSDGIGDTTLHHVYYDTDGSVLDDASAVRADEEYGRALAVLLKGDYKSGSKIAGIMTHYIADLAVFGHVMGSSTPWGSETHHSDYENYVLASTQSYYSEEFDPYLVFDGTLTEVSAYDAAMSLAYDTTFDVGGDLTCVWMDENYDWNDPLFMDRAGESLNIAVNLIADVLHTLHLEANETSRDRSVVENRLPSVALSFPRNDSVISRSNPILTWEGSDPDYCHMGGLTYDVYFDDIDSSTRISEGREGTVFPLSDLSPGSTYHWKVIPNDGRGPGNCNSGTWTFEVTVDNSQSILLVDDDMGQSFQSYYTDSLDSNGYDHTYWNVDSSGSPTLNVLGEHDIVIWFTADDYQATLTRKDKRFLELYLNAGGSLFLSGQDMLWDIAPCQLTTDLLRVASHTGDVGTTGVTGVDADPISDDLVIPMTFPFEDWTDEITPAPGAEVVFTDDRGEPCALRFMGPPPGSLLSRNSVKDAFPRDADGTGSYKVVFFSFPFEAIGTGSDRNLVMERVIKWLAPPEPPIANAGPDRIVPLGSIVTLNGSGSESYSPIISYRWIQVQGSHIGLENNTTSAPDFIPASTGLYRFSLNVKNSMGLWSRESDHVNITVLQPPVADAGDDRISVMNNMVTLNALGSSDDSEVMEYEWKQLSGPPVSLSDPASSMPTFVPEVAGLYVFSLRVADGDGLWSLREDVVNITVLQPPVANAGTDRKVAIGTTVILNGTASTDDGSITAYDWSQVDGPPTVLTSEISDRPSFVPLEKGVYVFALRVRDDDDRWSPEDLVNITALSPPEADAGEDLMAVVNTTVTLNGTGSNDDGLIVTYRWRQAGGPSEITLINSSGAEPSFVPTVPGIYTISLMVRDDDELWSTGLDHVNITVIGETDSLNDTYDPNTNDTGVVDNGNAANGTVGDDEDDIPGKDDIPGNRDVNETTPSDSGNNVLVVLMAAAMVLVVLASILVLYIRRYRVTGKKEDGVETMKRDGGLEAERR